MFWKQKFNNNTNNNNRRDKLIFDKNVLPTQFLRVGWKNSAQSGFPITFKGGKGIITTRKTVTRKNNVTEGNGGSAILCAPDETAAEMLTKIEAITLHRSQAITRVCSDNYRTFCTHNTRTWRGARNEFHNRNTRVRKNVLTDSPDEMHVKRGARQYGVRRRSTARIRCLVGAACTGRSRVSAQQQNKTKTSRRRRVPADRGSGTITRTAVSPTHAAQT